MSRSYREQVERLYPGMWLYYEDSDRRAYEQGMREWYEDQAGQIEYAAWLDTLEERHGNV